MADYTVLYHEPVRVSPNDNRSILAAHSVWVCRNDRYAFEVHVFGLRGSVDTDEQLTTYGEGRYRLALAVLGGQHARRVAADNPPKADPVLVNIEAAEIDTILASVPPAVAINFGDVIYRFVMSELPRVPLAHAVIGKGHGLFEQGDPAGYEDLVDGQSMVESTDELTGT